MQFEPDYISQKINSRCATLGLSLDRAIRIVTAESPTDPYGLLRLLGLDFQTLAPIKPRRWLWMSAQTSSVSYKRALSPEVLQQALGTGCVPAGFESNMLHFLDEAPVQLVVMAVGETAQREALEPARIWANVAELATQLGARRTELWS